MPLAVNVGAVALPFASVTTVTEVNGPGKKPLAPLPGAAKVTLTPEIGMPAVFLTTTARAVGKALLTATDWLLPAATVTLAATSVNDTPNEVVPVV